VATTEIRTKSCSVNPLKSSQPLGAAAALMGLAGCMPMLHAAQGCTAFALVLLVRHFREAVPLQTTAMNEVSTILGGHDNLEEAILNVAERAHPKVIGICSSGLTEARGEDIEGDLKLIRARHAELADTALIHVSTPDYKGGFEAGWGAAVTAIVDDLVETLPGHNLRQVNILAGAHLTPADVEEVQETVEAFGLAPIILPDLSRSLDGHVANEYVPTTLGGTAVEDIRRMGRSVASFALGLHVEPAARLIEQRCGVPVEVFSRLTGLRPWDDFVAALARISGKPTPPAIRRRRSQLIDAVLDGHFFFGGKRVAIAAEPDLLLGISQFLVDMGATIACAVTTEITTAAELVPGATVVIGDLDDLERGADGCDLIVSNAHGHRVAVRLGVPSFAAGFPLFDRLGAAHRLSVGYTGARDLIFEIGNIFLAQENGRDARGRQGGTHAALAPH